MAYVRVATAVATAVAVAVVALMRKRSVSRLAESSGSPQEPAAAAPSATMMAELFREIMQETRIDRMYGRVVQAIRRLLPVERATVFLVDHRAGVLRVIESCDVNSVTTPLGKGVAGAVVESGRAEIVPDAYADPRFDRSMDIFSGFKTRSILAVPVLAAADAAAGSGEGQQVLAVLQALNKQGVGGFGAADAMLLEMLATLVRPSSLRLKPCRT